MGSLKKYSWHICIEYVSQLIRLLQWRSQHLNMGGVGGGLTIAIHIRKG